MIIYTCRDKPGVKPIQQIIFISVAELASLFGVSTRKLVLMLFMIQEWFLHSGMNRAEKLKIEG